jgi:hypothetical protein
VTEHRLALPAARWVRPTVAVGALVCALAVGAAGGLLARLVSRSASPAAGPALPAFHGQAVWAPGARPEPRLVLRGRDGARLSLAALRGRTVLLAFLGSPCRAGCRAAEQELGTVMRALPAGSRPALVLAGGGSAAALAGPWSTFRVGGSTGEAPPRGIAVYLVDRAGDERTAYRFPFLPAFVEGDLARLAGGGT